MDRGRVSDRIDEALGVESAEVGEPEPDGRRVVALTTARGPVGLRHHPAGGSPLGVVWVGGVGGGFDSPGRGLYPLLGTALAGERVASAQVRFRQPGNLDECVHDCLAGLWYLRQQGATDLAAVGHSFGGAVVVRAALADPSVRTVVTLATQSYGTEGVSELAERCSLLAVHGAADEVLPDACSRTVRDAHGGHARLVVYPRAGHLLDGVADELSELVLMWLVEELGVGG